MLNMPMPAYQVGDTVPSPDRYTDYQNAYETQLYTDLVNANRPGGDDGDDGNGTGTGSGGGGGYSNGLNPADYRTYAGGMEQFLKGLAGQTPAVAGNAYNANVPNPYEGMKNPWDGVKSALAGRVNPLTAMIDPAIQKDLAYANKVYDEGAAGMKTTDPYAGFQARQTTIDPKLAAFMESQGMDMGAYTNQVGMANAVGAADSNNWQNFANAGSAMHQQAMQNMLNNYGLQRANVLQGIQGQGTGLRAQSALGQERMDREAIMDQQGIDERGRAFGGQTSLAAAGWTGDMTQRRLGQEQTGMNATADQANQTRAYSNDAILSLLSQGLPYGQTVDVRGLMGNG